MIRTVRNHNIDTEFFPGWTRKSLTFTIDDGNLVTDKKFLDIVKPRGIVGTFNLCMPKLDQLSAEGYREFYRGYEIANHCMNHPTASRPGFEYKFTDEPFNRETADPELVYRSATEGIYYVHLYIYNHREDYKTNPSGWHPMAFTDDFKRFASNCHDALTNVFGEGSIRSFVWPHGKQYNDDLVEYFRSIGYNSVRRSGDMRDKTGFDLPSDRFDWTYNAHNKTVLEVMKLYEEYPDDGKLKFFALGVHSHDFERTGNWEDLVTFADLYGARPETYYYATVSDIFDYEDAVSSIVITDDSVHNPSEISLYITVDGKRIVLRPHSSYNLS